MAALSASAYINKVSEHKDVHVRLEYRHVRNFIGIHCISSAGVVAQTTSLPIMCLAQFPTGKTWPDQIPHERNKCPSTSPPPAQNQHRDFPGGNTAMLSAPFVLSYLDLCHIFYSQSICYSSSFQLAFISHKFHCA